ncbi:hypothetical protein M1413_03340 [Patescibacteria group bacterium]|nr:hypothetical protein [Patescibacteria group bacterium]MCL5114226.1 hypothetical protein [Patescibacteria group bacterium]
MKTIVLKADEIDRIFGKGTSFLKAKKVRILVHKLIVTQLQYNDFKLLNFEKSYLRKSREKPYVFEVDLAENDSKSGIAFDIIAAKIELLLKKGPTPPP